MKRSKKRFFIESGLNGVSEVDYTLNDRDQRTAVQYPGVNWNYGYDDKGQLTGAEKSAGDVSETYSYTYDGIGNRLTAQEGASQCGCPQKLDNLTWCKMPVKLT